MQRYKTQYRKEHNITDVEEDASISLNRFRDNDELKYSLRSLEKNAPWIHHIYIVTNGQIPSWLDTSNPKVTIVTHKEIFTNPKALPTFSSPSIEMNLHHIHGLSDYFIYFNDDVFLGSPVLPADFMTLEKGQILYSSWEVPECSKLCKYSMLNNNICDSACNNRECGFDLGDCANVTPVESELSKQEEAIIAAKEEEQCNSACDQSLLENDQCDEVCNTVECGYDRGLCRSSLTNHYNLTFFCRVEDSLNLTKSLRLHPRDISDADYFVEKEYTLETTSYCVARMIVHQTHFIILHIDPILSAHFSIQTINCLEPEMILTLEYDPEKQTIFILFKPSIVSMPFTIHLVSLVDDEEGEAVIMLIDVLRMGPMTPAITEYITRHHPFDLKYKSTGLSVLGSMPVTPSSHTVLLFSVDDPWKDTSPSSLSFLNFSYVVRPKRVLSYLQFNQRVDVFLRQPSLLFNSMYSPTILEKSFNLTSTPNTIYVAQGYVNQVIELDPSDIDAFTDIAMVFSTTFNYNHPRFESFQQWKGTRKAYLGLSGDVFQTVNALSRSRQARTCNDIFRVKEDGFSTGDRLSFWREVFEFVEITDQHNEIWSILKSKKSQVINPYSDLENIQAYNTYYSRIQSSKVILAIPVVEVVTCFIDKSIQVHLNSTAFAPFIIGPDEKRPSEVVIQKEGLPFIQLSYTSAVYNHGVTSAVTLFRSQSLSEQIKESKRKDIPPRRLRELSEYDIWLKRDQEELNQRNLHHLTDYLHRMEKQSSRRLGDSYRESLIHTNLQLIRLFGRDQRYVPAHMPHFINKQIMAEIEEKLAEYVNDTIFHRFREGNDLQYSFLYFHYLKGKEEAKVESHFENVWRTQIDTNNNGVLDANEFTTLAAIVYDTDITANNKIELLKCLVPDLTEQSRIYESNQSLFLHKYFPVNITYSAVVNCSLAYTYILSSFPFESRFQSTGDTAVAFQMIDDDVESTRRQLNSVRARQSKFVCINDNIKNKTDELDEVIHSFYESFFPTPSAFEKVDRWKSVKSRLRVQWKFVSSFRNLPGLSFYLLQFVTVVCVCLLLYQCTMELTLVPFINVLCIETGLFKFSTSMTTRVFVSNSYHNYIGSILT